MARLLFAAFLVFITTVSFAQKKPRASHVNLKKYPEISYEGTLVHSISWTDKAGKHIFVASETGARTATDSSGVSGKSAHILAQHFLAGDTLRRTWTEGDSLVMCPLETEIGFLPLFQLTDLDKDGYKELWIMFRSNCHNDISPARQQLVMHEDMQRFTMIGTSKVRTADNQFFGGEYQFNNQFLEGNPAFKKRGMDIWNDFMKNY